MYRMLVVDDEPLIVNSLCSSIEQNFDVELYRANSAFNAMTLLQKMRFDVVITDISMPVMNGLEATKAIRKLEDPWASRIPIIAMTADAFSENVAECLAAGMNGHIAKPIDMKLVLKEIRRIKEEKNA